MKQINKTPKIQTRLQKAVGDGVSTDDLAVYEVIALNTLPLRKESTLYKGAVAERGLLLQMAEHINTESLPVQIMHNSEPLPIGRVFYGEVQNTGQGAELRALIYVAKSEKDVVLKIDSGVVDQVSVSILPKQIVCSACGFDYLGPKATFDNLYEGNCDKGHKLGEAGVHANLIGLDKFFELSLVGRGGAQNARIVNRDKSVFGSTLQHLAASGLDLNKYVLAASSETNLMEMEKLIADLTDAKAAKTVAEGENASLKATMVQKDAKIVELTTQLTEAGTAVTSLAAKDTEITGLKGQLELALVELKDIAKGVLVASGDVNATVPETVAELVDVVKTKGSKMKAFLSAGGVSEPAHKPTDKPAAPITLSAFRTVR